MNNVIEQIVKAITTKKQISFYVNNNQILGSPCAIYVDGDRHNNDVVLLDLFQTAGHSRMGGLPTMKIYKVSEITEITVLDERPCFVTPPPFNGLSIRYARKLAVLTTPAPRTKVGDWVLVANLNSGKEMQMNVVDDTPDTRNGTDITLRYANNNYGFRNTGFAVMFPDYKIIRKLQPSEVKVTLSLEGTVEKIDEFSFNLEKDGVVAELDYELLSPSQSALVRELVED